MKLRRSTARIALTSGRKGTGLCTVMVNHLHGNRIYAAQGAPETTRRATSVNFGGDGSPSIDGRPLKRRRESAGTG
jgi:hypothetical protein